MKNYVKKGLYTAGLTVVSIGSAVAAVPAEVTTAMTDAKADAIVVAGLSLVIVIAIAAFRYMKRASG